MRNILVTGASSGIGEATVHHLAGLGMRVFAAVRDPVAGEALRTHAQGAGQVVPVVLDVRDEVSIARAVDEVRAAVGSEGLAGLVNNAGEGIPGPLEMVDLAQLREQLEVNVVGQVAVTQAALSLLRQARGRIVFVGSIGGKVAVQFAGPYHASKYAIEAIGDCLRQELAPDDIAVAIIEPGPISTGIWDKAAERIDDLLSRTPEVTRYRERLLSLRESLQRADEKGGSPDDVAKVIGKALTATSPATRYPDGTAATLASAVKPWIPYKLYDAVVGLAV
jgi:NAD(P)-dependent dehydrogenase (short-subunit alcohol dehydrogenase family)